MADGGMVGELKSNPVFKAFSAIGNILTKKPPSAPKATGTNFYGYAKDPGEYQPTAAKPKKAATMSKKKKAPAAMPKAKVSKVIVKPGYPSPKKKK